MLPAADQCTLLNTPWSDACRSLCFVSCASSRMVSLLLWVLVIGACHWVSAYEQILPRLMIIKSWQGCHVESAYGRQRFSRTIALTPMP